ncbi:hypothetical protein E2562_014216 [Oryza meyeriana var. granulata]|uniref:Uncharacterized protein n=1 Tax=Oryza meyeriana var. granulata TaxID=110450 RepID=A0A6G1BK22_9ORYZ|nr:hypothetical protein E2562_014216 [Oryza meyeriana var. granulata]
MVWIDDVVYHPASSKPTYLMQAAGCRLPFCVIRLRNQPGFAVWTKVARFIVYTVVDASLEPPRASISTTSVISSSLCNPR